MATRDPDLRRSQLIEAAITEFATFGIAGARVDRIAKAAGVSAGLIYVHFNNKEELFDRVYEEIVTAGVSMRPSVPEDLAEFAGTIFDTFETRPDIPRLVTWYRLERADAKDPVKAAVDANRMRIEAIARMQDDGKVTKRFTAAELFGLILHLAGFWEARSPEYKRATARTSRARRREVIVDSVSALLRLTSEDDGVRPARVDKNDEANVR